MLLAFKSIALGVRKHSSQSPKTFIPVFEKKDPSHFDLTYTHFALNHFCIKHLQFFVTSRHTYRLPPILGEFLIRAQKTLFS